MNKRLHVPSARLAEALALHEQLLEAVANSNFSDWRELPGDQLPLSWNRKRGNDRRTKVSGPSGIFRQVAPNPTEGTGEEANPDLVGPSDRANNDNDQQVGTTSLLNPFQGPHFSELAALNDQVTEIGQANTPSSVDCYNTWEGMDQGASQIPAADGCPDDFQLPVTGHELGVMYHGPLAPGATFSPAGYVGYQPNPFVALSPHSYQPGYNPYAAHPIPASTSHQYNHFDPQPQPQHHHFDQQQHPQLIVSVTQTTSQSGHYQLGPSAPQTQFLSNPQHSLGQPGSLDHIDTGFNTPSHQTLQNNPSTPVNQGQDENESYRFNGSGSHSIRQNPNHRLNTDIDTVMQRNNPFRYIHEGSGPFSSFEDFLEDEM